MSDKELIQTASGKIIEAPRRFDSKHEKDTWLAIKSMYENSQMGSLMSMIQFYASRPDPEIAAKWRDLLEAEQAKWEHCETCGKFMAPSQSNEEHHVNELYPSDGGPPVFKHFCDDHCPVCNGLDEQET